MAGQESARIILQALVQSGDLPPALLFTGHSGTGKTSSARILGAALNCAFSAEGDCCGECPSCLSVSSGGSLTVYEIDAASGGGVDAIRSLKDLSSFAVPGGQWRVIILDEAHCMSRQAFNALLKVLEEPPTQTVFVLLTTEPDKILSTVRSRSMPVPFRPLPVEVVRKRLSHISEQSQLSVPEIVLAEIAESSSGGMRDAVMLLDQSARTGVSSLEDFHTLTGKSDVPSRLAESILKCDVSSSLSHVRDYFSTSSDSEDLIQGLFREFQWRYSNNSLSVPQLVAATRLLWDARIQASNVQRSKTQIESLAVLLCGVFQDFSSKPILRVEESPKSQPRRLTAEEAAQIEF